MLKLTLNTLDSLWRCGLFFMIIQFEFSLQINEEIDRNYFDLILFNFTLICGIVFRACILNARVFELAII